MLLKKEIFSFFGAASDKSENLTLMYELWGLVHVEM